MNMDETYLTEEEAVAEAEAQAQALRQEIYETAKQDIKTERQAGENKPAERKKKVSYQTAFRLTAGLVLLLLAFFIGMKWIEHARDKRIVYYENTPGTTLATKDAADDNAERAIPQIKVNINTADVSELMTLPGIGEVRAQQIVAYRNEYGRFTDLRELMNISGIGDATFEKLLPYITLEDDEVGEIE